MTKWEYKITEVEIHLSPVLTLARWGIQQPGDKRVRLGKEVVEQHVNDFGKEGWELVGVSTGTDRDGKITKSVLFFRRPLPD